MSIDTKEWAAKLYMVDFGGLLDDQPSTIVARTEQRIQFMADLIRAVIADEAPNITKAVLKFPLADLNTPQPQPAEPVGDVPEKIGNPLWDTFLNAMSAAFDDGIARTKDKHKGYVTVASKMWPELTRRVAEATAEKDRRIAELEALSSAELARGDLWKGLAENADAEIKALKLQLSYATAEVERLTKERTEVVRTLSELFKICAPQCTPLDYPMGLISQIDNYISGLIDERDRLRKRALPDGWEMSGSMIKRQDEIERLTKDNTKLREEVARLSRPVESVTCGSAATFNPDVWVVSLEDFQREQNAREDAESERDELREFVRTRIIESWYRNGEPVFHDAKRVHIMSDANLDELLTAYRAEKAKVTT